MYGSFTYGQSEYAGLTLGDRSPYYLPVFENFTIAEVSARASVIKTFLENFVISETTRPSRTYTYLEGFVMNDVSVREVLNGQSATWIRIPKTSTTWNSLPKN